MKLYTDTTIKDFEFWSGAKDTVKYLTDEDMELIEQMLEGLYPEGISKTELNDFFWFEDDMIADWLGFYSFENLMDKRQDQ